MPSNTNKIPSNTKNMIPKHTNTKNMTPKHINSKNMSYNDLKLRYEKASSIIIMQIQQYISLKKKIKSLLKTVKNNKESANINSSVSSIESGVGMTPILYN